VGQTVFATGLTIVAMLGLSLVRTNWAQIRNYLASPDAGIEERVSGD